MADNVEQLVALITEHVLAALATTTTRVGSGSGARAATPAAIHPPIGTCTGDYSKFEELRASNPGATKAGNGSGGATSPAHAAAFTGFVTARMLDHVRDGIVQLAPGARLTPLARDEIRARKLTVVHADGSTGAVRNAPGRVASAAVKPAVASSYLWWADGHCPAVSQLTAQLRDKLRPASRSHRPGELHNVSQRIARDVRDGRAAGGVLFVHSAALAACYANRCPSLRAVVGTCGQAVEQGIRLLGANVLIVEYPHHGVESIRQMLNAFTTASRPALPTIDRQLRELNRCV